jgi:ATP-dependent Clp protease ATP-binding subunit ClpA
MFERYTEKARRVIFFARYEASQFGSPEIETEHLLLGLLREDKTVMHRYLHSTATRDSFRSQIESHCVAHTKIPTSVDLPLSKAGKRVLAFAAEEAERLGHRHIGTEHLLLGLSREQSCFAAELLRRSGADLEKIRKELKVVAWESAAPSEPQDRPPAALFAQYTEKGRRAIFHARYEASLLGSPYIESEHLLLGALREAKAFLDVFATSVATLQSVRAQIEEHTLFRDDISASVDLPLSNECKRALGYATEEATLSGQKEIGPEHLLLGLLREERCFAARLLRERGADIESARKRLATWPRRVSPDPESPGEGQ